MPKLNTGICGHTVLIVCEKIHQFLSNIKKTHSQENCFFCLTVYIGLHTTGFIPVHGCLSMHIGLYTDTRKYMTIKTAAVYDYNMYRSIHKHGCYLCTP